MVGERGRERIADKTRDLLAWRTAVWAHLLDSFDGILECTGLDCRVFSKPV
jgi:hypothetical protein